MKKVVVKGFFWRLAERFGSEVFKLLVTVILARLLDPETYGQIAVVSILISFLQVFVDSGFGAALIQKKDVDDDDFSTVFWFNNFFFCVLYAILYVLAPSLSIFFHLNNFENVIRTMGLSVIFSGIRNTFFSYLSRNGQFKLFFESSLIGNVLSAIVGILLAYKGCQVWALVAQTLTLQLVSTAVLWLRTDWKPKYYFSMNRLITLFGFGSKILFSRVFETVFAKYRSVIIGKAFSVSDLAYYEKGSTLPSALISGITSSIDGVMFPEMATYQNNISEVLKTTRKTIQLSTYILMPLMFGFAVCARPIISILLTEKWISCVPYFQIFSISYAFYPLHTANITAMKALGRSDIYLKLEIIKKIIGILIVVLSIRYGITVFALTNIFTALISPIINIYPNRKIMNYKVKDQINDVLPNLILALLVSIALIICSDCWQHRMFFSLITQVIVGIIVFMIVSIIMKLKSFSMLIEQIFNIQK